MERLPVSDSKSGRKIKCLSDMWCSCGHWYGLKSGRIEVVLARDYSQTMGRFFDRPGDSIALFLVAAAIFYAITGSALAAAIGLLLEIGFWFAMRQFKKRPHQAQ